MTTTATPEAFSPETSPPVQVAWSRVMADATSLSKDQRNAQQGFNFRGIDDVMNLVGPILRTHGVAVIPTDVSTQQRDLTTKNGTVMHEVTCVVEYTIVGPAGDTFVGYSAGESADAGDKATPKAMSVAFRVFLLQALCLPTDSPDPDQTTFERGAGSTKQAEADKVALGLPSQTELDAVTRVYEWSKNKDLLEIPVTDAAGNSVPLEKLFAATRERLGDTSGADAAEKAIANSLGGQKVGEEPAAGQEGEQA